MNITERDFCPRCAIKHLAQARVLLLERDKGYPLHAWYALGHLAEAEDEIVTRMPDEAAKIREQRLLLESDTKTNIDFGALMTLVADGALIEKPEGEG